MKKLNGYEKAQAYSDTERLPVGGYVLKILDAVEQDNSDKGWNNQLILSFDIAEGEHKDFFAANYKAQAGEDKKWKGISPDCISSSFYHDIPRMSRLFAHISACIFVQK